MHQRMILLALVAPLLIAVGPDCALSADERDGSKRMVLVELYTSQGCDMCPTAEKVLGTLAWTDPGIVPIAFHVDYFKAQVTGGLAVVQAFLHQLDGIA